MATQYPVVFSGRSYWRDMIDKTILKSPTKTKTKRINRIGNSAKILFILFGIYRIFVDLIPKNTFSGLERNCRPTHIPAAAF